MIEDKLGAGIWWANQQIWHAAEFIHGDYVFILDDDDFLISDSFIAEFKDLIENSSSTLDVIIVKGFIDTRLMPLRWELPPMRGGIGAPNFIVSKKVFYKHAKAWNVERAGDAHFIESVWSYQTEYNIRWWDKLVFYADPSYGMTEGEKRRAIQDMLLSNGHA
jgi:glycosyltransferase involved in cell wall biosynthesis